jgi:hypothetical protein
MRTIPEKGADALPIPRAGISVMLLILIVDNNSSDLPVIEPVTEPPPTTYTEPPYHAAIDPERSR